MKSKQKKEQLKKLTAVPMSEEQFLKMSSVTPLVNVDLFITNEMGEVLLEWRDDLYCGTGWHIPGGIIRNGETRENRLQRTAQAEIGLIPDYKKEPVAVNEIILKQKARNHFISFLYYCFVKKSEVLIGSGNEIKPGTLKWFTDCPKNLVFSQQIYQKYLKNYFLHKNK